MEGAHAGKHFIEHGAECENVGARIGRLTTHLFRRHIARCPHDHARRGKLQAAERDLVYVSDRFLRQLRQSKIEDLDSSVFGDEHIFRLQVAVHDSLLVRCRQSVGNLHSILDRLTLGQGAAIEGCPQAAALQELGDQKRRLLVLADVMNGENVGVVERRHRPRLLLKAMQAVSFAGERCRKNFEGHIASQAGIRRAINFSHAACANQRLDFVRTEFSARGERHAARNYSPRRNFAGMGEIRALGRQTTSI